LVLEVLIQQAATEHLVKLEIMHLLAVVVVVKQALEHQVFLEEVVVAVEVQVDLD
jgi:hypothetical protein